MKMPNLNSFTKISLYIYIILYLIFPNLAIAQITKVDIRKNLENALNSGNLKLVRKIFEGEESLIIQKKFLKFRSEFPDSKWQIKKLNGERSNQKTFGIKVTGEKKIDGETFLLESNFMYLFSTVDVMVESKIC